jgi:hypothetical protein
VVWELLGKASDRDSGSHGAGPNAATYFAFIESDCLSDVLADEPGIVG